MGMKQLKKTTTPGDDERTKKVMTMALQIVFGMVEKGALDPDDPAALQRATRDAVRTAKNAYDAVQDFLK